MGDEFDGMSLAETDKIVRLRIIQHRDSGNAYELGRWNGYRGGMVGGLVDCGFSLEEIAGMLETSLGDVQGVLRERARMAARGRLGLEVAPAWTGAV